MIAWLTFLVIFDIVFVSHFSLPRIYILHVQVKIYFPSRDIFCDNIFCLLFQYFQAHFSKSSHEKRSTRYISFFLKWNTTGQRKLDKILSQYYKIWIHIFEPIIESKKTSLIISCSSSISALSRACRLGRDNDNHHHRHQQQQQHQCHHHCRVYPSFPELVAWVEIKAGTVSALSINLTHKKILPTIKNLTRQKISQTKNLTQNKKNLNNNKNPRTCFRFLLALTGALVFTVV